MTTEEKRQKIIDYLIWKDHSIEEKTGLKLCIPDDYDDIDEWSPDEINYIYDYLHHVYKILSPQHVRDTQLCPWCIINNDECEQCSYATRHGLCENRSSAYSKIVDEIDEPICRIINFSEGLSILEE